MKDSKRLMSLFRRYRYNDYDGYYTRRYFRTSHICGFYRRVDLSDYAYFKLVLWRRFSRICILHDYPSMQGGGGNIVKVIKLNEKHLPQLQEYIAALALKVDQIDAKASEKKHWQETVF